MSPLRERNPLIVAAVGLSVLGLLILAAAHADELPIIGGGTSHRAEFSESAGLQPKDDVRVAGVKVGTVTRVALDGDHVNVTFQIDHAWIGDQTTAAIKIKTLFGAKYLALDPQGTRELTPAAPIPRNHTYAPYDVQQAFSGLASTIGQINTAQLAQSLTVLADTFRGSPANARGALDGLSALSRTISARDNQLIQLVANTSQITHTLAEGDNQFQRLLTDGNQLLAEVRQRKDTISRLLAGTRSLAQQMQRLVADNTAQLRPALDRLDAVAAILQRNQDSLDRSLRLLAPYFRLEANALGNGRWIDVYVCGLLPPAVGPVNQNGCAAHP
jgi:phospholipid/cholesterol/gamma-HCH transport system substrate-binding protein